VSAGGERVPGTLFVVSTPIGHLGDLSPRAVEVLRSVAAILAEDTRHTRHLTDRFDIPTPLVSYHEHNEAERTPGLVARLHAGESLALVSDAGTPLLSDPGARLVAAVVEAGLPVSPVPGPSALLAALVGAGLPADRFTFFGFLPRKGRDRQEALASLAALPHVGVVYEAANRVAETLAELAAAGAADRPAVVARELTKQFETFHRGTVASLAASMAAEPPRGEVVLVIGAGAPAPTPDEATLRAHASRCRADGMSAREVQRVLMDEMHAPRNLAYRIAHE